MTDEKLTITLTDRAPVTIVKDQWPVIASSTDYAGEVEAQASRTWRMTVRQHADGRAVVYGVYTTRWQGESGRRGGQLLASGADLIAAINAVAEDLGSPERVARTCIADLPAEEI